MQNFDPTPELLSTAAGIALSLAFTYIPGLRERWAVLTAAQKSLGMLGALLVVSLLLFGASCGGAIGGINCGQAGAVHLALIFLAAAVANQSTYQISPPLPAVKQLAAAAAPVITVAPPASPMSGLMYQARARPLPADVKPVVGQPPPDQSSHLG